MSNVLDNLTNELIKISRITQKRFIPDNFTSVASYVGSAYAEPDYRPSFSKVGAVMGVSLAMLLKLSQFKLIGYGHFSIALTHRAYPNHVFKVSLRSDDAYSHYALWCRANPNEHAPKILKAIRVGAWHIYVMPRYIPFDTSLVPELESVHRYEIQQMMYHVAERWTSQDDIFSSDYDDEDYIEGTSTDMSDLHRKGVEMLEPSLVAHLYNLGDYFSDICNIDINSDNFMWCTATKKIIITDPVSFNEKDIANERQIRANLESKYLDKAA